MSQKPPRPPIDDQSSVNKNIRVGCLVKQRSSGNGRWGIGLVVAEGRVMAISGKHWYVLWPIVPGGGRAEVMSTPEHDITVIRHPRA